MKKIHYCWVILGCSCVIICIAFGLINNVAGVFIAAVCEDMQFSVGRLSVYFTIMSIVMVILTPFAGKWLPKSNIRITMISASVLLAACFMAFSFGSKEYHWWIVAPFLGVSSVFLALPTVPILIRNWFDDDYGFAIGLAMAFSGIGGVLFTPLIGRLLPVLGWRMMYRVVALVCLIFLIPVCLLVRIRPEEKGLSAYRKGKLVEKNEQLEEDIGGISLKDAFHMKEFYFMLIFTATLFFSASMNQHAVLLATTKGLTNLQGTTAATILMGVILISRLFLGRACDRYGVFWVVISCSLVTAVGVGMLMLRQSVSVWEYYAYICLYGIGVGMSSLANPQVTSAVFGKKEYSKIYSYSSMVMSIVGAAGLTINGVLYDIKGNYFYSLALIFICCCATIGISFMLKRKAQWEHTN